MNNSQTFDIGDLTGKMAGNPVEYLEFLKVPRLSCGVYHLAAGEKDPQQPHEEDEIYFVTQGRATFKTETTKQAVAAGLVLYVAAGAEHRFMEVTEDLTLLVFFAAN